MRTLRAIGWFGLVLLIATPPALGTVFEVEIVNFQFVPDIVTIQQGDSVHWSNSSATVHTVTSGTNCTSDGIFDSGDLAGGEEFGWRFNEMGDFPYYCIPHCQTYDMTGTVEVTENTPAAENTWGKIKSLYR